MRAIEFLPEVGDKMSRINLDQSLANTPPAWKKFISLLPPQLAREFVDERPVPNPLRLTNSQPVTVSVADLLRHPENQGSIGRSPDDVIAAVNQQWGLKIPSGKKYDPTPERYRVYAQMTPKTASPSVAVDGVIIFGAGRFVAAALRGDETMRVWSMSRKQGVAEGLLNEFAPVGGDDRESDEEELLRQLASMWWLGTEQQMIKAQKTLAAMGWEIGQDESGDDDAGVFVIRVGDVNGDSYMAFPHSELNLNEGLSKGN
jgi:hypothetical protein